MEKIEIKKTFYSNGQIEREESLLNGNPRLPHGTSRHWYENGVLEWEGSFKNGIPHGPNRTWHPNGILATEVNLREGVPDGIGKQWDKTGKLILTYEIINGTGTQKHWSEEQGIGCEISLVNGSWTGRQRTYDREGIIKDDYWIKNRKVPIKKYIEACKKDPTLPRYEDIEEKKETNITKKSFPEADNDEFCINILSSRKVKEAREWFKSGRCFLGEGDDEQGSTKFVESLYKAGAVKVWVFDINLDESGEQYSGRLIIEMPKEQNKRKKIFANCDEIAENLGFDAEEDYGQQYRLLMLD